MVKWRTSLSLLVTVSFIVGVCYVALAEVEPHPEDWAFKLAQTRVSRPAPMADIRANPLTMHSRVPARGPNTDILWEGFEGGVVPPTGWTTVVNNAYTWEIDDYNPYEGSYNASCYYDPSYSGTQDEWLIGPTIDLTQKTNWVLDFWWLGSYYWSVDPYNNCDLVVLISTDGGSTWPDTLWSEDNIGEFSNWTWYQASVDLSGYITESNVKLAFRYYGYDGAQFSLDAISVNDAALPNGRCCYGDPQNPDCVDTTEGACDALGGSWNGGLDCTTPCPISGPNDDCENAEMIYGPFPQTVNGTNEGAQIDCPGVLDWNAVWYKFDAPYQCNDIVIDYCGSPYDIGCIGVILYDECPTDCPNYLLYSSIEWLDCSGLSQPKIYWDNLPGPATYYIPVFIADLDCNYVPTPFQFSLDVIECPPPETGDWCDDPLTINLPGDLPYSDENQYTCGRGDYYSSTCLGAYDGGEDIVYQVNVASAVDVNITLDPKGTGWTGILIDDACPPDASTCIDESTNSSSSPHGFSGLHLEAGTYYIMIDTWPSPDCIPDFDLTITQAAGPQPGDDCTDPIVVKLPADMPYSDLNQTNCGRGNDYSSTCLGSYDNGEDIMYQLDVTETVSITITMDPKGTTWTGMLVDDTCPADATCIAKLTGSSGSPKVIEDLILEAGTYYIMVDTWPSPNCIPNFDLTIVAGLSLPELTIDPTEIDFGTVSPGDTGDTTLTLGNTGGQDLTYEISIDYNPAKEIDGAYIATSDSYSPGATMGIHFILQNASSDAEWLDEATMTFPSGVTVNSATDFVVQASPTHYLQYDGTTGDAVMVTWFDHNGGWGNIYSSEMAESDVNLTFDGGLSGDLTIDYTISGDDYGSPPHDVSGSLLLSQADPTTSWLTVDPTSGTIPGTGRGEEALTVSFTSQGLPNGTYVADIVISHNARGEARVPVTLTVGAGVLTIDVHPDPVYAIMAFSVDPDTALIHLAEGFDPTHSVNDIHLATVMVNGGLVPLYATVIPSHDSMTAPVLEVAVDMRDFILSYGLLYDTTTQTYTVSGNFTDSAEFSESGSCTYIGHTSGDLNLDGAVNIADLTYFVSWLFQGGPAPVVIVLADVNASGGDPNVADLTYLVGYLFSGGPAPYHQ